MTNEPRPRLSTRPSATSSSIARRTVARLTPSSSQSQRSEGSRSPGSRAPLSISLAISPVDPVIERLRCLADRHVPRDYPRRCRHVKPLGLLWSVMVRSGPWGSRRPGCGLTCASCPGALGATIEARARASPRPPRCSATAACERIVATGNGAAYYVAHALWLASLEAEARRARRSSPCRAASRSATGSAGATGDAVLAVSSSGEFRDVVEIARAAAGSRPCVAITADASSSLAGAATETVLQTVAHQRAVTHTQALAGAYAAGLALWSAVTGDTGLLRLLDGARGRDRDRGGRSRGVGGGGAAGPRRAQRRDRRRRRGRMGRGDGARADAQGGLAGPGRGRGDARGRDVGDVRARARPPDGLARPGGRRARRRGDAAVRGDRSAHARAIPARPPARSCR